MSKPVDICGDWDIAEGIIGRGLEDGDFLQEESWPQTLVDGYNLFQGNIQELPAWVISSYNKDCDILHLVRIISEADSDEYMAPGGQEKVLQLLDELPYANYAEIMHFSITRWGDYHILAVGRVV
jgi:hypothetical protein